MEYRDQPVCRLRACPHVCTDISGTTCPNFTKFSVHIACATAGSSSGNLVIRYELAVFVNDTVLSYNGSGLGQVYQFATNTETSNLKGNLASCLNGWH